MKPQHRQLAKGGLAALGVLTVYELARSRQPYYESGRDPNRVQPGLDAGLAAAAKLPCAVARTQDLGGTFVQEWAAQRAAYRATAGTVIGTVNPLGADLLTGVGYSVASFGPGCAAAVCDLWMTIWHRAWQANYIGFSLVESRRSTERRFAERFLGWLGGVQGVATNAVTDLDELAWAQAGSRRIAAGAGIIPELSLDAGQGETYSPNALGRAFQRVFDHKLRALVEAADGRGKYSQPVSLDYDLAELARQLDVRGLTPNALQEADKALLGRLKSLPGDAARKAAESVGSALAAVLGFLAGAAGRSLAAFLERFLAGPGVIYLGGAVLLWWAVRRSAQRKEAAA